MRGGESGGRLGRLIPVLTSGTVLGVLEVVVATSFAALVFTGPLAGHLPRGIGLALFGAVAVMTTVALTSSLGGSVGSVQDTTAAILALATAGVAARGGDEELTFLTVVLTIAVASVLTGVFFLALGAFRLGDLVRFVPYPVVGGFLAGTGWLLSKGAMGVLADTSFTMENLRRFGEAGTLRLWLPGLGFAVVVLLATRRWTHSLLLPAMLAAGVGVFYAALPLTGTSVAAAEAGGWLLGPFPETGAWRPWALEAVGRADWGAVVAQGANVATMVVVALLALLLNASGIELAVGRDIDLNRELRSAGLGNLAAGLGGGLPGFHALSLTALAYRAGAMSRLVGVVGAGVCLVALLFGASLISLFPRAVLGGLLLFLGLAFLVEWVVDARRTLPRTEYGVVLLILIVVAAFGFLQGVAVGVVMAVILFVVDYSRTDLVKHELSGAAYRSKVDRAAPEREHLRREGDGIHILELQGFLFFGTAHSLLERIRERAADPSRSQLRFMVLDFRRVTGIDSSAVLAFLKARKLADARFTLVLTGVSDRVRRQLERGGFGAEEPTVRYAADLDRGVQACEDAVLAGAGKRSQEAGLGQLFAREPVDPEALLPYLERLEVPRGEVLIRQGEPAEDVYFLERGRLTAELTRDDGVPMRLRTMGPGTVVGELALYLGITRAASVVAEEASTVYRLTRVSLEEMERTAPELAAALHRSLARLLADRLAGTLEALKALMD